MPKRPSPPRTPPRDLVMVRLNAMDRQQRETNLRLHNLERGQQTANRHLARIEDAIRQLAERLGAGDGAANGLGALRRRLADVESRLERLEGTRG